MNIWDICFNLINNNLRQDLKKGEFAPGKPSTNIHREGPTRDFFEVRDLQTAQTLRSQNLKKHSSNTRQVLQDQQRFAQANIVWVFGPDGDYSFRIDVRQDSAGNKTGECYSLRPTQQTLFTLPEDPHVTLQDLLMKDIERRLS